MLHPEPHLTVLLNAGGAQANDEKIDYIVYSQQLESRIAQMIGAH